MKKLDNSKVTFKSQPRLFLHGTVKNELEFDGSFEVLIGQYLNIVCHCGQRQHIQNGGLTYRYS